MYVDRLVAHQMHNLLLRFKVAFSLTLLPSNSRPYRNFLGSKCGKNTAKPLPPPLKIALPRNIRPIYRSINFL